jgi:hypothetical protein
MNFSKKMLFLSVVTALTAAHVNAQVDSNFHCYILFGQSNMTGGGATSPVVTGECDTTSRVKVMAYMNCTGNSPECKWPLGRTADKWYTAFPPLHDCGEGICPGDFFAKTMLDSIRSDIKIGLIPCALAGVALNVFLINGPNATIGPANGKNAYTWMINRCKIAQQTGVIKGILLHQGESGTGNSTAWDVMAIQIFDAIKKDLNLDSKTPVVVGELRSDNTAPAPNNTNFNKIVDGLPGKYSNCAVASSQGLVGNGRDVWHFTPAGFQELGIRYAKGFLSVASPSYMPRKGTSNTINKRVEMFQAVKSATSGVRVYSLNGRAIGLYSSANAGNAFRNLNTVGVYIVSRKLNDGRTAIVPFIKE